MAVSFANVTVTYDRNPPNYTAGETIRLTVNGQAVNTTDPTTTTEQWGPFTIPITAAGVHLPFRCLLLLLPALLGARLLTSQSSLTPLPVPL